MGEKYIGDLLEELDKAFQEHKLTAGELEDKSIPLELIREGFEMGLIRDASEPLVKPFGETIKRTIPCILTITGFEYLNQIRIKKEVEQLNGSIAKFNESSDKAYKQLNDSIENFNVSSDRAARRLEWLTYVLIAITVLLICLTLIEMFLREEALWVKFIFTILMLGLFFIVYFYKENKLKFTK
ncbi:MAG: hypothetical protein KKG76_12455 [Euryarchaeota archaeon]|nr:hypothetical protein [Euryarchaeota archaeon]